MTIRKKIHEAAEKVPYIGDILTTEISTKGLLSLGLASYLSLVPASVEGVDMSHELMFGKDIKVSDFKASGGLGSKMGYFFRSTSTVGEEGPADTLSLVDLSYSLGGGLDLVLETQFPSFADTHSRLGFQYFGEHKDLATYVLATQTLGKGPETALLLDLEYAMPIGDKRLSIGLESLTEFTGSSCDFDEHKYRVGISKDGTTFGIGRIVQGEFSEEKPTYETVLFVEKEF